LEIVAKRDTDLNMFLKSSSLMFWNPSFIDNSVGPLPLSLPLSPSLSPLLVPCPFEIKREA
jgi:hypothetical protein